MTPETLKALFLNTLDNAKAKDMLALDVRPLTQITDFMIFCSGTSSRHIKALSDHLVRAAKENHIHLIGVEGTETSEWIIVDAGDVVVHLMQPEVREFYQLEKLWGFQPELAQNL